MRSVFWMVACIAFASAAAAPLSQPAAPQTSQPAASKTTAPRGPLPLTPEQVLAHLNQTIGWYRRIAAIEQMPVASEDAVIWEKLHQTSITALQLTFDFGHAAAALLKTQAQGTGPQQAGGANEPPATGMAGELDRAAVALAARVAALEAQLKAIDAELAKAPARQRETLVAQRAQVAAALSLAKEVQGTIEDIEQFEEASSGHGTSGLSGLAAQIAELQRSVPESRHVTPASRLSSSARGTAPGPATSAAGASAGTAGASSGSTASTSTRAITAPAAPSFRPESAGIISLSSEWFSLQGTRRQLADALKETDSLLKELDSVRAVLVQEARTAASADGTAALPTDPAQLEAARQQIQAALARFRQLSTVLVPLGEQGISVENARNTLLEWRNALLARSSSVVRYLALRTGLLLASIAVLLAISEIWRRATFRYLHDARRRRQFLTLRRVVVGVALTIVIMVAFVSEIGSVATYAGFVTAGIAVALQNVILAVVAYFFLIGRYGVRVGDRVTLAGVTGRVVEIGLIRIYLMELTGPALHSTGRIVVMSNAVLFQPSAMFKQIPGVDYVWHSVTFTLAPTADIQEAGKRLQQAADSVYQQYRSSIEQQHAVAQRFVDFDTSVPRPELHVRLTEAGLECEVRYPVLPEQAASIDQKMVKALRDALARAPELKLVSTGAPALKATDL